MLFLPRRSSNTTIRKDAMRIQSILLCSLLAMLMSCSDTPDTPTSLRIGILPVLDTLPLQVAAEQGLFKEEGLDVELVTFASAHERDVAMQSGVLDGYFGDMLITLLMIQNQVPMRIVTMSYKTFEGQRMFGLVTAPGKEAAKGMSIGISRTTIIEYLLDRMQEKGVLKTLEPERVEVKKIPIRLQMLLAGQLDAALLPEPLLTLAESKGGSVLTTDEDLDMPLTVICLNESSLPVRKQFLKAYTRAVERINEQPRSFQGVMAETIRIPEPLLASFPVYRYPDPAIPTENDVWRIQQWMLSQGLLDRLIPYESIVP